METPTAPMALSERESALAERIRSLSEQASRDELVSSIEEHRVSLREVARAFARYPSPLRSQSLGVQQRDIVTLVRRLTSQNSFSIELVIPTRALIGRSMVMARLNFFRMLRHVVDQLKPDDEVRETLDQRLTDNIAECVYQKAAEEILTAIVCRSESELEVRKRAAQLLLQIWDAGPILELHEVIPALAQTWKARRRIRVAYGTMLGASEVFALLTSGCNSRFIDFLVREDCGDAQLWSFREFMFGISYEDLQQLEENNELISSETNSPVSESRDGIWSGTYHVGDSVEQFYQYYLKRHLNATTRSMLDLPGPKQTAEQYVLEHLLKDHWDEVNSRAGQ